MPYSQFLARSKSIFAVFDLLKPAALRQILLQLGLDRQKIKDFGSLKLLGALCQLCDIALANGWSVAADQQQIVAKWDPQTKIPAMSMLFSLNDLRKADAHPATAGSPATMRKQLATFSIDPLKFSAGWGLALDSLYDALVLGVQDLARMINRASTT